MEINALLDFLRNPQYRTDPDQGWGRRFRAVAMLLPWALGVGLVLALLLGILESLDSWDMGEHLITELLAEYPATVIFLLATVAAPAFEELLFRGPLWFFRDSRYFKAAFWTLTLAFALVHLTNFPGISQYWYLAPLLVSPQLALGIFLGFVRVRFGLLSAILFHAAYNGILLGPALLVYPAT